MALDRSNRSAESGETRRLPDFPDDAFQCSLCRGPRDVGRGACKIVRKQVRGVTMACRRCGLHFAMTWHELSKAARKRGSEDGDSLRRPTARHRARRVVRSEFEAQ